MSRVKCPARRPRCRRWRRQGSGSGAWAGTWGGSGTGCRGCGRCGVAGVTWPHWWRAIGRGSKPPGTEGTEGVKRDREHTRAAAPASPPPEGRQNRPAASGLGLGQDNANAVARSKGFLATAFLVGPIRRRQITIIIYINNDLFVGNTHPRRRLSL